MSLIAHAKQELDRINFGEEDTAKMIEILELFFDQWDSGGAVWAVAPILQKLIAGKPLSPLTGADDEWMDHGPNFDLQNKRCGSVFKNPRTGQAHDIDAAQPREIISFPYYPKRFDVSSPVVEIETKP